MPFSFLAQPFPPCKISSTHSLGVNSPGRGSHGNLNVFWYKLSISGLIEEDIVVDSPGFVVISLLLWLVEVGDLILVLFPVAFVPGFATVVPIPLKLENVFLGDIWFVVDVGLDSSDVLSSIVFIPGL
uniref:B-127 protein n=1 Tax=Saccharomyces cerevisiae TaxID=4932 RepID=E9PA54_YEASX|nr:B-127 protein [Saccharomyces cerevisiae]